MKRNRLLVLLLAVCMLLGLLAGCDGPSGQSEPTTEPQQTTEATLPPLEGTMELSTAADLQAMASNPVKTYVLKQDIDMGGAEWTGIAGFRSIFEGNGHTISNVTIVAASGSADLGFFGDITEEGEVKDLNLANVTIDASATSAKNIGTVAGTNAGKVTNCTATGIITDTREDAMSVGALVGTAAAGAVVEGGTSIAVTDDAGVYTTEGLAADVKLFVADHENVKRGLVGTATGATVTGLGRDRFYSSERNSDIIKERQQIAVDYMYAMGTVQWTVPETIKFSADTETSVHNQTFEPGVVYSGMPYTHPMGSMERFLYCFDENNQLSDWAVELHKQEASTTDGFGLSVYMGNDCSGAVDWAWLRVSSADPYKGGAIPQWTHELLPIEGNQKRFGIYPVGQMKGDSFDYEDAAYEVIKTDDSREIVAHNGEQVMLEAYAMARKADAVDYYYNGGHVRMLSVDPMVIRNADGSVDAKQSYMITMEQGDGLYERKNFGTNSSWRINYRYAFDVLLNGSSKEDKVERQSEAGSGKAYLPITIRALRDDTVYEPVVNVYPAPGTSEIKSPERGSFSSNFRIMSTHLVIKDLEGNVVKDEIVFTKGREINNKVELGMLHDGITKGMEPGDYTFTITATLSNGSEHIIVENMAYTQK